MGARSVGLGVVVAVLLVALIGPMRGGRRIAGTVAPPILSPAPQVGECVQAGAPGSGSAELQMTQLVPCSQAHLGEVITKTAVGSDPAVGGRRRSPRPNLAACATTAYKYLGARRVDSGGDRSPLLGPWWPAFAALFQLLGPGPLQRRAGQSWNACVMVGSHGPIGGGTAHLFTGATPQRNPIALCVPRGRVAPPMSISCDQPHPREILGWRVADAGTDAATSFARSCAHWPGA